MGVKGIGPWTADVYLLTCLGHDDAWPAATSRCRRRCRTPSTLLPGQIRRRWSPSASAGGRIAPARPGSCGRTMPPCGAASPSPPRRRDRSRLRASQERHDPHSIRQCLNSRLANRRAARSQGVHLDGRRITRGIAGFDRNLSWFMAGPGAQRGLPPAELYPLSLWSWQDTIKAVFLDRVTVVSTYEKAIHSPSFEMRLPSVVSLKTYVKPSRTRPSPGSTSSCVTASGASTAATPRT